MSGHERVFWAPSPGCHSAAGPAAAPSKPKWTSSSGAGASASGLFVRTVLMDVPETSQAPEMMFTWTPQVCKMMTFWAACGGFGP